MADFDTTQILVALALAIAGIVGTWLGSGHLTRKFEKRKRKYDVKLEKYSIVTETFDLLRLYGHTIKLTNSAAKAMSRDHESKHVERDYNPGMLLLELWSSILILKSALGLDVSEDYLAFSKGKLVGIPIYESQRLEEPEVKEEVRSFLWSQLTDLMRCWEILGTRMLKGLSALKVVGSKPIVADIEKSLTAFSIRTFPWGITRFGKVVDTERLMPLPENWEQMIDGIEDALAEDLEGTL